MKKEKIFGRLVFGLGLIFVGFNFAIQTAMLTSAFAQDFGVNLLVNPDAEGNGMEGWVDPDGIWEPDAPIAPHDGNYLFWPGKSATPYTYVYQDVDVNAFALAIDNGQAYFNLSGWMANWDQYPHDMATLALSCLDASGTELLYIKRNHRSPSWGFYQMNDKIPPGTRVLRVYLIATRFVGSDDDGYFDDLWLSVENAAPTVFVQITSVNDKTTVPVDSTLQLQATTVGGSDASYDWSSSFEAVATVDTNGLVTAHKSGRFTVQAIGRTTGALGSIALVVVSQNDVIFQSPAEGARWKTGSTQVISWQVVGSLSSGTLYWSSTGGSQWDKVADIADLSTGKYDWSVPDSTTVLNNCVLKMEWDNGSAVSPTFSIVPVTSGVQKKDVSQPESFQLSQNYPNPFNPTTTIDYLVPAGLSAARVRLEVFNLAGQEIVSLVNARQTSGSYRVSFEPRNLEAGVYLYRLQINRVVQTRKMIYLK